MIQPYLFIAKTENKGRGVFTTENIPANTIIEIAPVIVMKGQDREFLDKTLLHDYIFVWGHNDEECCMALGWVSIYNHNYSSNCDYDMDFETEQIMIKTVVDVAANEELTINYNGEWNSQEKIWFEAE
jgi:uncharacterized protein